MRSEILMFLLLMKKVIALLSVALLAVSVRIAMPAEAAFPTPQITIMEGLGAMPQMRVNI